MKYILTIVLLTTLINTQLLAQSWTARPGASPYVHRIKVMADRIIACGDQAPPLYEDLNVNMEFYSGEGYRTYKDGSWSESTLQGFSVRDLLSMPNGTDWIAAIVTPFVHTGGVLRSSDAGQTWSTEPENVDTKVEQLDRMNTDTVTVVAAVFNSSDGFRLSADTCRSFYVPSSQPVSTRSVERSQADSSYFFMAGDGQGLGGVFWSNDTGRTWHSDLSGLSGKRILCVTPSKWGVGMLYCGADSVVGTTSVGKGIWKSDDTGRTWRQIPGTDGARVWVIREHPVWGSALIAAADDRGVLISNHWGEYWEQKNDGLPANTIVRTVELAQGEQPVGSFRAWIGTYGSGVYESSLITTDVAEQVADRFVIAPNPATERIHVSTFEQGALRIVSASGVTMLESSISEHAHSIDVSMLANGVYTVIVNGSTQPLVIVR